MSPIGTYQSTTKLPRATLTQIGQIIVNWAHLEWLLSECMYLAGCVEPKVGRYIVEEPRAKRRVLQIQALLDLTGGTVSIDLKALHDGIEAIENDRNNVAHGTWLITREGRHPELRLTSGTLDAARFKMTGKHPRQFVPEAVPFDSLSGRKIAAKIRALCEQAALLRSELKVAMPPLCEKRQRRSRDQGSQ